MMRWDLIDRLLPKERGSYLEIGIEEGQTGAMIKRGDRTTTKHGVDVTILPITKRYYHERFEMSSDAFFAEHDPRSREHYDVIFIDGLHHAEQVLRDIRHSLSRLKPTGTIVVHDCNPRTAYHQEVPRPNVRGRWNGDVWKAIAHLRSHHAAIEAWVIDADEGLGIIRPLGGDGAIDVVWDRWFQHWSYETLEADRERVLGLVSVEEGLSRLGLEPMAGPKADTPSGRDPRVAMYGDPITKRASIEAGLIEPSMVPAPSRVRPSTVVVVTSLFGDYDVLRDPTVVDPECDYVCITDRARPSNVWRMLVVDKGPLSDVRASRHAKAMIHEYVPQADVTLYIDASFELRVLPKVLIDKRLASAEVLVYAHPERQTVWAEATACMELGKDDESIINAQMQRYHKTGYVSRWLSANGILVRRMTDRVIRMGSAWWDEIEHGSHRDQLSFPVVCDRLFCDVARMTDTSIYQSPYAKHHKHKHHQQGHHKPAPKSSPSSMGIVVPSAGPERPRPKDVLDALRNGRSRARHGVPIKTLIAYDARMDLGGAYNELMAELPTDDDWAVFLDHDAMWTTSAWYHQIVAAIEAQPDAGLFTAVTNRVGNKAQRAPGVLVDNHDIRYHRKKGRELFERHYAELVDVTDIEPPISGVVMVIKKAVWARVGGFARGFLGVDNRMHVDLREHGLRIYMLKGLYVYHWYRAENDKAHLALLGPADRVPYTPREAKEEAEP